MYNRTEKENRSKPNKVQKLHQENSARLKNYTEGYAIFMNGKIQYQVFPQIDLLFDCKCKHGPNRILQEPNKLVPKPQRTKDRSSPDETGWGVA